MPLPAPWDDDDNFKLRQGSREPGAFRVGKGGGAAVLSMLCKYDKIVELLKTGVESARPNNSTGKINRILPVAHPFMPWMFLRDIDNGQGLSFREKVEADPQGHLEAPSLEYVSQYEWYELQGRFEPRPYAVIADVSINPYTLSYYDTTGAAQTKTAWYEDYRYTEWIQKPAAEYLTADKGQYVFASDGATGNPTDNSSAGVGQIRKQIPGAVWILKWHMVPYNYVLSANTYFSRYIGHVNQKAIWGFLPGEALLQAVNVVDVYSPTFPEFDSYGGYDVVSQNKLCDIEFVFLEAERTPTVAVTPTNLSHVTGGHNCVVYAGNSKFFYVENYRTGAKGTGVPIYPSVPMDLLFQNPDGPA